MVKKIIIINKSNTRFVLRNNIFENLGEVNTSPIKRKALALISNHDNPKEYEALLGKGILYIKYIGEQ